MAKAERDDWQRFDKSTTYSTYIVETLWDSDTSGPPLPVPLYPTMPTMPTTAVVVHSPAAPHRSAASPALVTPSLALLLYCLLSTHPTSSRRSVSQSVLSSSLQPDPTPSPFLNSSRCLTTAGSTSFLSLSLPFPKAENHQLATFMQITSIPKPTTNHLPSLHKRSATVPHTTVQHQLSSYQQDGRQRKAYQQGT